MRRAREMPVAIFALLLIGCAHNQQKLSYSGVFEGDSDDVSVCDVYRMSHPSNEPNEALVVVTYCSSDEEPPIRELEKLSEIARNDNRVIYSTFSDSTCQKPVYVVGATRSCRQYTMPANFSVERVRRYVEYIIHNHSTL